MSSSGLRRYLENQLRKTTKDCCDVARYTGNRHPMDRDEFHEVVLAVQALSGDTFEHSQHADDGVTYGSSV